MLQPREGRGAIVSPRFALSDDARRNADRDRGPWHGVANHGAGTYHGAIADGHAVEDLRSSAQPCPSADGDAGRSTGLREHRLGWVAEVMFPADQVAIGGDERVATDSHRAG